MSAAAGRLILNADDWGRDTVTTDLIFECWRSGALVSVSAMVYMEDSRRAAEISRQHSVNAGLHLNFTTHFSARSCPSTLLDRQAEIGKFLLRHRFAQVLFHPGLTRHFDYVVKSQLDEFQRLYGIEPDRVDGHHHMHLCANVVRQQLMPPGTQVRRNFTFQRNEKGYFNRLNRRRVDRSLARRHRLYDYLFSLLPLTPSTRLQRIFSLSQHYEVEVITHPVNAEEYTYLTDGRLFRDLGSLEISLRSDPGRTCTARLDI